MMISWLVYHNILERHTDLFKDKEKICETCDQDSASFERSWFTY